MATAPSRYAHFGHRLQLGQKDHYNLIRECPCEAHLFVGGRDGHQDPIATAMQEAAGNHQQEYGAQTSIGPPTHFLPAISDIG